MKDKNAIVVAIGLIIMICIVASISYGNYEFSNLLIKTNNTTDSLLLHQKDVIIKKLVKQLKARQSELNSVKAELNTVNTTLNNIKAQLAAPAKNTHR